MHSTHELYTDGGARGNPGLAGVGVYVKSPTGESLIERGELIGIATNNVAEYTALLLGLRMAFERGITHLHCFLDSELVVQQVNGVYRVKEPNLQLLSLKVQEYKKLFEHIEFTAIVREKNRKADELVNSALDFPAKTNAIHPTETYA